MRHTKFMTKKEQHLLKSAMKADKNVSNENGLDSDASEKISQSEDLESTAEEISQN